MILLWHGRDPIGIVIFSSPAASLRQRSRALGLTGCRNAITMAALNEQLWVLQRVVIHPTYRGAGIAAGFVRRACQLCPVDWIETLSVMGRVNPFFERAGFRRIGVIRRSAGSTRAGIYGVNHRTKSASSSPPDRFSAPVYYLFDNRGRPRPLR